MKLMHDWYSKAWPSAEQLPAGSRAELQKLGRKCQNWTAKNSASLWAASGAVPKC